VATFTVTDSIIHSSQAEAYFTRADRRVMIGLRTTLEMLQLPVPDYAKRRKPGRTPAKAALAAYAADNPPPRRLVVPARKPNASPRGLHGGAPAEGSSSLFDQVFSG
jgi:hypothetical protein